MPEAGSQRPTTLAIIPARGGSKGISRKNLQRVGGVPLAARTVCAARAAGLDRVIVSTDDEAIAQAAVAFGAEVVRRPADIAGDFSSSEAALLHVLETLGSSAHPDILLFLQCTSPFTTPADIGGVLNKLITEDADCCFTAVPTHEFLWRIDQQGCATGVNHDGRTRPMRQERSQEFRETGAVYAMRTKGFLVNKFRFFGRTVIFETEPVRSLDIDSPADLELARKIAANNDALMIPARGNPVALSEIRAIAMDFDGVFTNDRVLVREDGTESVLCNRSDGYGLSILAERGMRLVVLSREANPVVAARCRKLGIEVYQGLSDKLSMLRGWCQQTSIPLKSIAYIGNDVPDIDCLREVGLAIAPSDAHAAARSNAHLILEASGGNGALREVANLFGVV